MAAIIQTENLRDRYLDRCELCAYWLLVPFKRLDGLPCWPISRPDSYDVIGCQ